MLTIVETYGLGHAIHIITPFGSAGDGILLYVRLDVLFF